MVILSELISNVYSDICLADTSIAAQYCMSPKLSLRAK